MGLVTSGVYPTYEHTFKIGTHGTASTAQQMATIADVESFEVSIENEIQEWAPMTTDGWVRRLQTGKGFSIKLSGKRNIGDVGNDYVAGLTFLSGQAVETKMEWTMPTGTKIEFNCVINISSVGGGSIDVDALEFEAMSNGKPTVTPHTP